MSAEHGGGYSHPPSSKLLQTAVTIDLFAGLENYFPVGEDFASVDQLEVGIIFKDLSEAPETPTSKKDASERRKETPMKTSKNNQTIHKEPKL